VTQRRRLTLRARLTLLYTALFAVCGATVVAISYSLVARLEPPGQTQTAPAGFLAQCRAEQASAHPVGRLLAKCTAYFQLQGAQHQRHETLTHLLGYSLITLGTVIVLAAALSWIAAGRALRPVHTITEAARVATELNLSTRIALTGPRDELRDLAHTFNDMLARLESAFIGQQHFIANASHELRTPLAVMRASVDVALDNPCSTTQDLRDMATDVRAAVDHAEHLIGALLLLARNERGLTTHDEVDLATLVEDTLDATDLTGLRTHITLEPAPVVGDPLLLERLTANLIDNAVRHNTGHGEIWVSTGMTSGTSQLTLANTGRPISVEDAHRIFEPFHRLTDRTAREGFGLGLTIVASIAAIHGGTATAQPRGQSGLTTTITFPARGDRPDT
jgi:signal transduction histidine kinase